MRTLKLTVGSCAVRGIREFKQIATAGADMAAGSKFSQKMRHCACTSVASSRSVKSDYVSRDVLR